MYNGTHFAPTLLMCLPLCCCKSTGYVHRWHCKLYYVVPSSSLGREVEEALAVLVLGTWEVMKPILSSHLCTKIFAKQKLAGYRCVCTTHCGCFYKTFLLNENKLVKKGDFISLMLMLLLRMSLLRRDTFTFIDAKMLAWIKMVL